MSAPGEEDFPGRVATLRLILGAMAGGVCLLGAVTLFLYAKGPAAPPSPRAFDTLRLFSIVDTGLFLAAWTTSTFLYNAVSKPGTFAAVQSAMILRGAAREGSALFGLIVCLLGAMSGALRVQPLYWANAVPALAFVSWALGNLPDEVAVRALLLDPSENR